MAEGFLSAKVLASKFYGLYSLLSELLSKQAHYDWGLRAVKSVLVVTGQLKRVEPVLEEEALIASGAEEELWLMFRRSVSRTTNSFVAAR